MSAGPYSGVLAKVAWLAVWRVFIRPRGRGRHTTAVRRVQRPRHRTHHGPIHGVEIEDEWRLR